MNELRTKYVSTDAIHDAFYALVLKLLHDYDSESVRLLIYQYLGIRLESPVDKSRKYEQEITDMIEKRILLAIGARTVHEAALYLHPSHL